MTRELNGYGESSIVGDNGVAITRDEGYSEAGRYGIAISGDDGISKVGPSGVAITGVGGVAQAGEGGSISIMGEDVEDSGVRFTVTGIIGGDLLADVMYRLDGHSFEAAN